MKKTCWDTSARDSIIKWSEGYRGKYTVFSGNFRNISTNSSILVSVCKGSYDRYVKHKRNDPMCDPWDSQT